VTALVQHLSVHSNRQLLMAQRDCLGFECSTTAAYHASIAQAEEAWTALVREHGLSVLERPDSALLQQLARVGVGCARARRTLWVAWCGGCESVAAYDALCERAERCGDPALFASLAQVDLDLERTFPEHPAFNAGAHCGALPSLRRVLRALSVEEPYVQGQNFVAAFALLALAAPAAPVDAASQCLGFREAEGAAFAVARSLLHNRLRSLFYAPRLATLRFDLARVAASYAAKQPAITFTLAEWKMDVSAFLPRWLLSVFVGSAPSEAVLRFWDVMIASPPQIARRACRHAAMHLLMAASVALQTAQEPAAAAAALRCAGGQLLRVAALAEAVFSTDDDEAAACGGDLHSTAVTPLRARNGSPSSQRKRKAPTECAPSDPLGALMCTPFGAALKQVLSLGDWDARHRASVAPPPPPSSAKRARRSEESELWMQATPVRGAAQAPHGGVAVELTLLKPRKL